MLTLRTLALAALVLVAAACRSVRPVEPVHYIVDVAPDAVWVTKTDDTVVAVARPTLVTDTIFGFRPVTGNTVAIPLDQVRTVRASVVNPAKTVALAASVAVAFGGAMYYAFIRGSGESATNGVNCGYDILGDPILYC